MYRHILTIAFILKALTAFSQPVELDIHQHKLSYFLKLEQNKGAERMERNSTFISGKGVAQPIKFRHKESNLPDLVTYYFYFEKDSTINYILYEWDADDYRVYGEKPKKTLTEISAFIEKYKVLYDQIFQAYGKSKSEGDLSDLSKIETGDFKKKDTWTPNDSTRIELYTVLSGKYEQKANYTINRTYKIRLYIYDVPKDELAFPNESKVKSLDSVLRTFLSDLQNKNIVKAKTSLSALIVNKVTNEQLESLVQDMRLDEGITLYFVGVDMKLDGSKYLMLKYKYKSDPSSSPKVSIKVLFDEKNKIACVGEYLTPPAVKKQ